MIRRSFLGGLFALPALVVGYVKSSVCRGAGKGNVRIRGTWGGVCKSTDYFVKWDHDNKRVLISHDDIRTERVRNDKYKPKCDVPNGSQLLLITRAELGCIMTSLRSCVEYNANCSGFERNANHAEIYYQRAMAQPPDYDIVVV